MEQTECSETSAYKIQTPRNYPEESIQHSEHGESLKSRIKKLNKLTRQELLLPQHGMRLCYQQYLKYRGGPSIATVQRWQPYYTYIHTYEYIHKFTRAHTCTHTRTHTRTHTQTTHTHTRTRTHTHTQQGPTFFLTCVCVRACVYIYIYTGSVFEKQTNTHGKLRFVFVKHTHT